jgi:UDP-hydrolysing UDP-N-acetyl-D-glucosamine 2-epimerase
MHLTNGTVDDIRWPLDARVRMQYAKQTGRAADVAALSRGIGTFGNVFTDLQPDIIVVLGDRIEAFAAASAAAVGGFRLAHLHGGDRAEGVADEAMRHAISKLAHLHFPATEQSRDRLIRMGESAERVFNVGSPAIDALAEVQPDPDAPKLIVMHHPVGDSEEIEAQRMRVILQATEPYDPLVMQPNHDPGDPGIRQAIKEAGVDSKSHLPRKDFLAKLAGCQAIVGNSSAGLIEAAALRVPCVNIGQRQAGREKPDNVIEAEATADNLHAAITQAIALDRGKLTHPYGDGDTGRRIADLLATLPLNTIPLQKRNAY